MSATTSWTLFSVRTSWTQGQSAHFVIQFINLGFAQEEFQFLLFDINSSHHVFEFQFMRNRKQLAEDIESEITADQAHQVVATAHRLFQSVAGFRFLPRKPELCLRARQCFEWRFAAQPAVTVSAVMALLKNKCSYNMIYSQDKYLDILPYRASKGKAIRYLSYKWNIALGNILVCGDSGNDEEMLRGELRGVVVGNYSPELNQLKGIRGIYFAEGKYAGGILEGIRKYKFIEKANKE